MATKKASKKIIQKAAPKKAVKKAAATPRKAVKSARKPVAKAAPKKAVRKAAATPKKAVKAARKPVTKAAPKKAIRKAALPKKATKRASPKGATIVGKVRKSPAKPRRRKVEPLRYRGAAISDGLEFRIRQLREKYRKAGRIVSFEYILDWYFQTEDEWCANDKRPYESYTVWKSEGPFAYEYVDLVDEGTIYNEYVSNGCIERLFEFVGERGGKENVRLYVKGVGEKTARRYGINNGLLKMQDELAMIAKYWKEYWDETENESPEPFVVPVCENGNTGVFLVDFNRFVCIKMYPPDYAYVRVIDEKASRFESKEYRDDEYAGWGIDPTKQYPKDKQLKKRKKRMEDQIKAAEAAAAEQAVPAEAPKRKRGRPRKTAEEKAKPRKPSAKKTAKPKKTAKKPVKAVKKAVRPKAKPVKKVVKKAVRKAAPASAASLIRQLKKLGYDVSVKRSASKKSAPKKAVKKTAKVVKLVRKSSPKKVVKVVRKAIKKAAPKKVSKAIPAKRGRPKKSATKPKRK